MVRSEMKASTLPELLVTMVVGGILLLIIFDGVDLVRKSVGTGDLLDFGDDLSRLQEREILEDRSDSVVFRDTVYLFYRNGEVIKVMDKDVQDE